MAERSLRRWLVVAATGLACAILMAAAVWTDVDAHATTRQEEAALSAAAAHLAALRQRAAVMLTDKAATTTKRDQLAAFIQVTLSQLARTNLSLNNAKVAAYLAGVDVNTLETCLGGIQNALDAIGTGNNAQATQDISGVSAACTQLEGGISSGLVYPYDFPDPDVITVGSTAYAYATNSVSGNIQIIDSTDLTHWTAVGNALPNLPSWATAYYTWAPSVAFIGGAFDLYYAVDPTGSTTECISVATSSSPLGPFVDSSTAPLECQPALGGAIDPDAFVDTNGSPYLLWKSGEAGSARIWAQQLDPSGTTFATGSTADHRPGARPVLGGRQHRSPRPGGGGRPLPPLLFRERLVQRQLRSGRGDLRRPPRAVWRCDGHPDPRERQWHERPGRRVSVPRHQR